MTSEHNSPIGVAWIQEVNSSLSSHKSVVKRGLTAAEITLLEAGGSRCADWARVRIRLPAAGAAGTGNAFDARSVARCTFVGNVELGND